MSAGAKDAKTYLVEGMTCGHCEASVRQEVETLAGVSSAQADRSTGRLEVWGEGFADSAISEAVRAAGYELARPEASTGSAP